MTDQVTSVEQSKRLIELGVPAEKASMVWHTMPAVIGRSKLRIAEEEHVGWMCRNFPGQYAPAFTVADLLAVLPKVMEDDEGVPFYLNIQYNRKEYSEIKYKGVYGILWSCFGASLLNNLVEAVDGVVTNGYELTL